MVTKELVRRMEAAFSEDVEFDAEKIQTLECKNFKGELVGHLYMQNNGEMEFSRGQIDAWLYFEYSDQSTDSLRINDPDELKMWVATIPR